MRAVSFSAREGAEDGRMKPCQMVPLTIGRTIGRENGDTMSILCRTSEPPLASVPAPPTTECVASI